MYYGNKRTVIRFFTRSITMMKGGKIGEKIIMSIKASTVTIISLFKWWARGASSLRFRLDILWHVCVSTGRSTFISIICQRQSLLKGWPFLKREDSCGFRVISEKVKKEFWILLVIAIIFLSQIYIF